MDRTRFRHLMDVVGSAMERPPGDRDAFLVRTCKDDPALLEEARGLLAETDATSLADEPRRALEIRAATGGSTFWRAAIEHRKLAEVLVASDRITEARAELSTAWDGLTAAGETSHPRALQVAETMARVQSLLGDEDAAALWAERARAN